MAQVTICPRCQGSLDETQNCPRCGGALELTNALVTGDDSAPRVSERWHQTPEGRIVIGVALGLGLCYGLLQLGMAVLRGLGKDAAHGGLAPIVGLALFNGLQALALLPAGVFAGAGQKRAGLLGMAVGLFSGLVFVSGMMAGLFTNLVQSYSVQLLTPGTPIHELTLFSLPVVHAGIAAFGALIGGSFWRAEIEIAWPLLSPEKRLALRREKANARPIFRWEGRISWGHILVGVIVAALGAANTPAIIDYVLAASDNQLRIISPLEEQIAYGEIFSLSVLLGGCIAGAGSSNGLKQGVCAGIALGFLMAGLFWKGPHAPSVVYPVICVLFLAPVGGWFGSELLPPTLRVKPRRLGSVY